MNNSLIQWPRAKYWTKAFNPVVGCKPVSEGCANCYAAGMVKRFGINGGSFEPQIMREARPPKSGVVFVGNMTDVFGKWVTHYQLFDILYGLSENAVNLVLTKRPERLKEFACYKHHIYFGATCENQARADERIPHLLSANVQHRWLSLEPLLGAINLNIYGNYFCVACQKYFDAPERWVSPCCGAATNGGDDYDCPECGQKFEEDEEIPECPNCKNQGGDGWHEQPDCAIYFSEECQPIKPDWVVVGAESLGNKAGRECKIEWVENIVYQCQEAGVPVFVKQIHIGGKLVTDINKFPEHLRIRQVPWNMAPKGELKKD